MFNFDMLTTMELTEVENPSLFPFPAPLHIGFVIIAVIFFLFRFFTDKRPFQLIMAIAVPISLLLRLELSRQGFYIVGAIELLLLIAAAATSIIFKKKNTETLEPAAETTAESSPEEKSEEE